MLCSGVAAADASAPVAAEARKVYVDCAVQRAFSVSLPSLEVADMLAYAAMRACEAERHALYERVLEHYGHRSKAEAEQHAMDYVDEVDTALVERLSLRLREAALRSGTLATSGSSI